MIDGPTRTDAILYRGVALFEVYPQSRAQPPQWSLSHVNTGYCICMIHAVRPIAITIATPIAEMADWSFDSVDGWKNTQPDLIERLQPVLDRWKPTVTYGGGPKYEEIKGALSQRHAT